jgi:colicin import membrane protein
MAGFLRENSWPVAASVGLHGLLAAGLLLMTFASEERHPPTAQPLPIDAVVVDSQVLHAAQRAQAERAEAAAARERALAEAKAAADAEARAAEDAKAVTEKQNEAKAQAEAQAEEANQVKAAEAAKAVEDAERAAEARKLLEAKQAIAEAKQAAEARQAAEAKQAADAKAADAKHAADERAKQEREAELRRQLADEEHVSAVESGPLRDRYITLLRNRIQNAWIKPPSATAGVDCMVQVTQVPGGAVTGARVTQCNGDAAVRQSIENAVYRASPLPDPPDPALFERNITLRFRPNE